MRTAKTSSIVAVMGAFVAFGVYVFIGVKGNLGLFDIGALVMYCGAFMQIVNGVMLIANTLGKLAEILPLARIYFEIIECTDSKQYGTRPWTVTDLRSSSKMCRSNIRAQINMPWRM